MTKPKTKSKKTKTPLPPPPASTTSLRHLLNVYLFILLLWGFYRLLFRLPEQIEEIILKPLIWLSPVVYTLYKEKAHLKTIGWTTKNLFPSIYWSLGLGVIFALEGLFVNYLKYGELNFINLGLSTSAFLFSLGLSFITAISEETAFRGFLFNRLWQAGKSELGANFTTSVAWTAIHLPISIFILHYSPIQLLTFLFLVFIFGIGSAFVFARTKNIAASILLHVLWAWPITLFR